MDEETSYKARELQHWLAEMSADERQEFIREALSRFCDGCFRDLYQSPGPCYCQNDE